MNLIDQTRAIQLKQWAKELGFDSCGISKAVFLEAEAKRLEKWLSTGQQGKMSYMENHFDLRLDPRKLMPGTKSVISLSYNYFPSSSITNGDVRISKYAYGEDYHVVVKDKLKAMMNLMKSHWGEVQIRSFVDSAPVLEKAWAVRSGIGWMGKNGNIITKARGSFFFLAEILVDVTLESDEVVNDHCGTCRACIDACPTDAIIAPMQVDGSKCISYFTIELKEEINSEWKGKWSDWVFGCDICQDVCPWNRFAKPTQESRFNAREYVQFNKEDWEKMEEDIFRKIVKGSALERPKWSGFMKNLRHLS